MRVSGENRGTLAWNQGMDTVSSDLGRLNMFGTGRWLFRSMPITSPVEVTHVPEISRTCDLNVMESYLGTVTVVILCRSKDFD